MAQKRAKTASGKAKKFFRLMDECPGSRRRTRASGAIAGKFARSAPAVRCASPAREVTDDLYPVNSAVSGENRPHHEQGYPTPIDPWIHRQPLNPAADDGSHIVVAGVPIIWGHVNNFSPPPAIGAKSSEIVRDTGA